MSPQFAIRVAALSAAALIVFAVIFFRLWYLEVLSGDEYLSQARSNQIREIPIQAPRGKILDSRGRTLVTNRTALSLEVRPDQLPEAAKRRSRVLRELSQVVGMPKRRIKRQIRRQSRVLPANPVTLKADVKPELVFHIRERQDRFPGITAGEVSVRRYPRGTMASHLFGYVSEVTEEQLEQAQYSELDPGDRIGADGLELQYDSVLRGKNGSYRVRVDAFGVPRGSDLREVPPETGNNLVLSLDSKVQKAGESALAAKGLPGAFVAMRVEDGAIVAMGSSPAFDPAVFTPPVKTELYDVLQLSEAQPLFNRALGGAYPTGSTFKPITAVAALGEGILGATETIHDGGEFEVGGGISVTNSGGGAYGSITVPRALQVSSNVFFAALGARLGSQTEGGLQKWASDLGIGSVTGVDLPGELPGLLPTPEWRQEWLEEGLTDRPWSIGDDVNLSIGQGDLQTNPLQMAVAYATIANGGNVVRPRLAAEVRDPAGRPVKEYTPAERREVEIPEDARQAILVGMRDAATAPGGTSYSVFGGFPIEVAGKTGTAERPPHGNQSWYASFAPYSEPEIVVAVTVENGGFGAEAAAPIAREIYEAYFGVKERQIDEINDAAATPDGATQALPPG